MSDTLLQVGAKSPFDPEERRTLEALSRAVQDSRLEDRERMLNAIQSTVTRLDGLGEALGRWPPVFSEAALGNRRRSLETLVELLATANDGNFDMFLPTRALVGRAVLMAELNAWRLFLHVANQVFETGEGVETDPIHGQIDKSLHTCVHIKITEELLGSVAMASAMDKRVRTRAVHYLSNIWEDRRSYRVQHFYPLLEATWNARRRIRVSVGTLLGVSEIFRLLQAGCDPLFVDFFSRTKLSLDEQEAFQEFLIGVPTERIHSLEQLMTDSGRSSLSPEEAASHAYSEPGKSTSHPGVQAYQFFRERYLQAAARRLKDLPGPRKTAEEYVLIYYLDEETGRSSVTRPASPGAA